MRPHDPFSGRTPFASPLMAVLALAGCGGNVPVSRGFGSHEVLALRDSTIKLGDLTDVEGQDPVLGYTTQGNGDAGALAYWSLDLVTGTLQGPAGQPSDTTPGGPTSSGRYSCQYLVQPDGTVTIQVTDSTTGVETDVAGATGPACPSDDGVLAIFRADPDQAGALGIYAVDVGSNQVTVVVPPLPASTAWAAGAPQAGSLQSASLSAAVGISRFNGHYVYARTMSDGGTTLFAGPFDQGPAAELALLRISGFGLPVLGRGVRVSSPDDSSAAVSLPAMASWQLDDQSGAAPSQMIVWDDTDGRVTVCPSTPGALQGGVISPDGNHVLFRAAASSSVRAFGPLQLVTMGSDGPEGCSQLIDDEVFWGDISGDGSVLAWIAKTEVGPDTNLWIANGDGSGAQQLFTGTVDGARFLTGTSKLELSYGGDLALLDVHDPTKLVYVAEDLFGSPMGVSDSWFAAGYDYSTQDSTGTLGAINLETGKKIQISPSVEQYATAAQVVPNDGDPLAVAPPVTTGLYHVAYLVRGRNPSSQDGIWVATIQAADLQ